MENKRNSEQRTLVGLGRRAVALAACAAVALSLAGCKDSDVLTEKFVGEPGQYEVDYSLHPVYMENPSATMDNDIQEEEVEEENPFETEEDEPTYDSQDPTTDAPVQQNSTASYNTDNPSTSGGKKAGEGDGEVEASPSEGEGGGGVDAPVPPEDEQEPDDPEEPEDKQEPEQNPPASDDPDDPEPPSGGNGGAGTDPEDDNQGVVIDKDDYSELPYANKIAASGQYATIVQALGGKGALACAPQQWIDSMSNKGAFPGELNDVEGISSWGDGSANNAATVQAIIDSGADTYLYSDTAGKLTVSERNALVEAGVNVVAMPNVGPQDTPDANIVDSVQIIGYLLEDSQADTYDALEMAAQWTSQHDGTLNQVTSLAGGRATLILAGDSYNFVYSGTSSFDNAGTFGDSLTRLCTAYIDDWDSSTSVASANIQRVSYGRKVWPATEWDAGASGEAIIDKAVNGVGLGATRSMPNENFYFLYQDYFQQAGLADTQVSFLRNIENASSLVGKSRIYGLNQLWGYQLKPSQLGFYDQTVFSLGDTSYPMLVVRDEGIAAKVQESARYENSSAKEVGIYNYGVDYPILIMPQGIAGHWTEGTFESFLMAPYVYAGARNDISSCESYVANFYRTFYRTSDLTAVKNFGNVLRARQ